jgi:FG-GAP repeat
MRFDGAAAGDQLGISVAAAGDVNGDGTADLLFGAPDSSPLSRSGAGSVYLARGFHHIARHEQIINLTVGSSRVKITCYEGSAADEHVGTSVAGGVSWSGGPLDILLGAGLGDYNGRVDSGSVYGIFGP